ncbi:SEC-C metal-binding domain-containing protein [Thalassotalea sp. G20_0]|uniref:SEC-C metal-binding domain-containing protein n=1 Tax=Thalassotalea sp. G20_0 TaxID=2821093 RepID=UPI00336AA8B2
MVSALTSSLFSSPVSDSNYQKYPRFQTGRGIGRNEPCPCGSGKKFKKCCDG